MNRRRHSRSRSGGRSRSRDRFAGGGHSSHGSHGERGRHRGADRHHGGLPGSPQQAAAMPWGAYAQYAASFPTASTGSGGFPGGGCWPGFPMQVEGERRKKKKKKKKKRNASSSSSSSSSSSGGDWRQKMAEMWQEQMASMWSGMQGASGAMWGWPPPGQSWPQDMGPHAGDELGKGGHGSSSGHGGKGVVSDGWQDTSDNRGQEPPGDVPIFLEPAIEEFVPVPKALLGKVIGKQAQTIIEIREKSGAFKVDARDQTSDPCMVKVAGTAEAVKKAKELIMEMVESTRNKHAGSDYVEIPRAKIGMVIGLKGAQVNEIQNQTGTKIDVDFDSDPCKCYVKGLPDSVDRAKKVLLTIAMQLEDEGSEYVDLPKTTSGALIGAQGSRIREFQEQSGARIDVDKTGPRCRVRLTGSPDQIAHARALILKEVEHILPQTTKPASPAVAPPPAVRVPHQPLSLPAHQLASMPATLSESIARAKAAAEAIKNGLVTSTPPSSPVVTSAGFGGLAQSVPVPPPAATTSGSTGPPRVVMPPPPPAPVVPPASLAAGGGSQPYRPW